MYSNCPRSAEILFAAADATWRTEAARILGRRSDDPQLELYSEAQGHPHTLLRIAYKARQRALAQWNRSRLKAIEIA